MCSIFKTCIEAYQITGEWPKVWKGTEDDLETVRSHVAKKLGRRRQAQVCSLSPQPCTPKNRPTASASRVWYDEGVDGGSQSDPGSNQSQLSLAQTEPEPLDTLFRMHLEKLEEHYKEKLEQLDTITYYQLSVFLMLSLYRCTLLMRSSSFVKFYSRCLYVYFI